MNEQAQTGRAVTRIVSGGQTGVDRAALDVALELGVPCGGWCPKGRLAEDGPLPARYPLDETPTAEYAERTAWNVRDSDGTLILTWGPPTDGTAFTEYVAHEKGKPCLVVDLMENADVREARAWLKANRIRVLNVAGPRASKCPGLYEDACAFLKALLMC
ncbi:MAG TPA: molybdenum cofactor carrier [Candidatus Hydrogenedentes bacterium]|nr:molybdenum cofactor carrier [Candidatus Hydrogenedentota bacterium]